MAEEIQGQETTKSIWHDMRGVLTNIAGAINLVTSGTAGELNEDQKKFLKVAETNINKLLELFKEASERYKGK